MDESNAFQLRDSDDQTVRSRTMNVGSSRDIVSDESEALFVINLCAAMTPIDLARKEFAGLEQYRLYQISRMEDGRRRYRLRLGFFTSESQAEDVLSSVRSHYATAFKTCMCEDDLKHASGYLKRSVQDLQRTGRFAVSSIRRDLGATTTVKALDIKELNVGGDTAIQRQLEVTQSAAVRTATPTPVSVAPVMAAPAKLPPAKSPALQPTTMQPTSIKFAASKAEAAKRLADEVVEVSWQPSKSDTARIQMPTAAKPIAAKTTGLTHQEPTIPSKATSGTTSGPLTIADAIAAMADTPKPPRESLMRRAQAMAPVDAVERAKAVPGLTPETEASAISALGKFKIPTNTPATKNAAVAKPTSVRPTATSPSAASPVSTVTPSPVAASAASSVATKAPPAIKATIQLQASTPPIHTAQPTVQKTNQPFHVGAGVQIPHTTLSLESSPPQALKPSPAPSQTVAPVMPAIADVSTTSDLLRARQLAQQSAQWRHDNGEIPTLDTTQTIRTLTKSELEDANRDKWFTVQLALSDHPANLDTMPHLDIFEAYTLYSVAAMDGGHIRHALRLGFFREEVSAGAVMGYLKTFFNEPTIVRIADAEYVRFMDAPKICAPKPVAAPSKPAASVVTLEQKRPVVPSSAHSVPTVNTAVERKPSITRSANQPNATHGKPMARTAPIATKRAANAAMPIKKSGAHPVRTAQKNAQQNLLDEGRLLGMSDTQKIRVEKNPSLLARLADKLSK